MLSITDIDILSLNEMSRYCFTLFMAVMDEGVAAHECSRRNCTPNR